MKNMTAEQLIKKLVKERDIAIGQLQSLGLQLGQSTDKIKSALDKQEPKKLNRGLDLVLDEVVEVYRYCPICNNYISKGQKYCDKCGQAIREEDNNEV